MTDSIHITNFSDTIYFSRIEHDTFCEYRLPGHVYEQVGFRNKSHFFTAFKSRFGCTPLQYQQKL